MPQARKFKPGFRTGQKTYGQVDPCQVAWLDIHYGRISIFSYPWEGEEVGSEINLGPNVGLFLPQGKPKIMLSNLTVEELNSLRELVNMAIDLALPVAAERDRIADVAAREGDDSNYRAYRRAPQLVKFEGAIDKHNQGLLFGPDGVPGSDGDSDSDSPGTGGASPFVAADGQNEGSAKHNATEASKSQGLDQVRRY